MTFFLYLLAMIAINLPAMLGLNLIFGKAKILYFGPITISLLSAYAFYVPVMNGMGYGWAVLLCLASVLLASVLLAMLSLRLPEDAFGVLSIALHLIALTIVLNWTSVTRGALGIPRIARWAFLESQVSFTIAVCVVALLWVVFLFLLDRSSFGRQLQALSEHPAQAAALGIDRTRLTVLTFVIGGLAAMTSNILFPQFLYLIYPSDYQFHAMVFLFMAVIAGKPGSVLGVTLSTALLILLREGVRFAPLSAGVKGPLQLLLFGCILFGVIWWRRTTLFPLQRRV